jgi:hypothetical protein
LERVSSRAWWRRSCHEFRLPEPDDGAELKRSGSGVSTSHL